MFAQRGVCWNRYVRIPRQARDDNDALPCHPERSRCRRPGEASGICTFRLLHTSRLIGDWREVRAARYMQESLCTDPSQRSGCRRTPLCHPELVEGSVRYACRIHPDKLVFAGGKGKRGKLWRLTFLPKALEENARHPLSLFPGLSPAYPNLPEHMRQTFRTAPSLRPG